MEITADHLLNAALLLPDKDRALLAAELIGSLDPTWDDDHEAAWSEEIAKRLAFLEAGSSHTVSRVVARQLISNYDQSSLQTLSKGHSPE